MANPEDIPGPTDDQDVLEESLLEAAAMLEEILEQVAEVAYTVGAPRGLLPAGDDGGIEFDENDLMKTGHPTLIALAKVAEAIYNALDTLPEPPESDEDDDEDEDDGGEDGQDGGR